MAHFYGDEEENPDMLETHVPYFTTVVPKGTERKIPLIKGQTTIRIIYDAFGNELEWRAVPDPLLSNQ